MGKDTSSTIVQIPEADYQLLVEKAYRLEKAEARISELSHELSELKRLVFGTKSERFEPTLTKEQLPLFERVTPPSPPREEKRRRTIDVAKPKAKPSRQVIPGHFPREVIVIEPEEDVSRLKKIGEEVSETLDYRPGKLVVLRRVRPKYVDPAREERGVLIAELPARPLEKAIAEPSLLAHTLISKYVDHLPYYRQIEQFKREGITFPSSTIGDWGNASADLLRPLYDCLIDRVRQSGYIQADETPIAVQDRKKKRKTHKGYYWVYLAPGQRLVAIDYQKGRDRDGPKAFLRDYRGALQCDGYQAYEMYDKKKEVTIYNCWAHARRHFFNAQYNEEELVEEALRRIGQLYEIEQRLRDQRATPDDRSQVRTWEAVTILEDLKSWLEENRGLPQSPWGKAARYSLTRWGKLTRYIEDGRIEIDNNLVENTIRPIALGRKNYLFAGSHAAAHRAAVIYSLLSTCKLHEVNPQEWLTDVLARIATHPMKLIDELLPHRWEKGNR
jgi:transposase